MNRRIRFARSDDWNAPFNMTSSIGGAELDRHLRSLEAEVRESGLPEGIAPTAGTITLCTAPHEAELDALVRMIRDAGAVPVLVAAPNHPRLCDAASAPAFASAAVRLREVARELAARYDGVYVDASEGVVAETGFADGQHLNREGRESLSAFVGAALPPAPRS
jgi:hypothetical protein